MMTNERELSYRLFLISLAILISLFVAVFVSSTTRAILREPLETAEAGCVLYCIYRYLVWTIYGSSLQSERREDCDGCGLHRSSLVDFWLCQTCWQQLREKLTTRNSN
jgi:hypothetical protein